MAITKKTAIKIGAIVLAVLVVGGIVAFVLVKVFGNRSKGLQYPDFPVTSAEGNSWEHWKENGEDVVEVDWFVNWSGYNWGGNGASRVSDVILEKTGCRIKFTTALNENQLNTLVAGNKLPDVLTVTTASLERVQLAEGGLIYPIQELAKRWAPNLNAKLGQELTTLYAASDGNIYGIPNHYYASDEIAAYEAQGRRIQANNGLYARKDYVKAYIAHKKAEDPNWNELDATRPAGFIEMCEWVKKTYIDKQSGAVTFLLTEFDLLNAQHLAGNKGIVSLLEFFNVAPEDESGNLTYKLCEDGAWEMYEFLFNLYQKGLLTSGNLSMSYSDVKSLVQTGKCFVTTCAPSEMKSAYTNRAIAAHGAGPGEGKGIATKDDESEYVGIMLTNAAGETPLIGDLTGSGFRYNMITANCKRPDRVIKLFDFLYSEEGQRLLYYGIEGTDAADANGNYYYTVRPNESKDGITYKYGQMALTDVTKTALYNGDTFEMLEGERVTFGQFNLFNLFLNPMYYRLTAENRGIYDYTMLVEWNLKEPFTPYTYTNRCLSVIDNAADARYATSSQTKNNLIRLWQQYTVDIVQAKSLTAAKNLWEEARQYSEAYGVKDMLAFQNEGFKKNKQAMGVTFAYPKNRPDYVQVPITSIFGDRSGCIEIPEGMKLK